ncbi:hypothetical protein CDL12_05587 [Handroanthus impetiginosus]|uniref:Uncharacterized protein n=1 Tax=Handroanthus impetiginosus TaxID=429701 RepID=A0A2G9HW60_9LAMI|nr:hypothetical protein CDL12_05587 [Handroanthus impetiginosus]
MCLHLINLPPLTKHFSSNNLSSFFITPKTIFFLAQLSPANKKESHPSIIASGSTLASSLEITRHLKSFTYTQNQSQIDCPIQALSKPQGNLQRSHHAIQIEVLLT